jgi:hypothetical protein
VATIPATGYELYNAAKLAAPTDGNGNFITADENDALKYLAKSPEPGGVITQGYLGALVPGITGRGTLLGDCLWSEPDCTGRGIVAGKLFRGELSRRSVGRLLHGTKATWVLADCKATGDLDRELGKHVVFVQHFGCAAVYRVD